MSKEQTDWVLVPRDGLEKLVRLYEEDFDDASEHRPDWLRQALYAPASTSTAEAEPVAFRYTTQDINGDEWPWTYTESRPIENAGAIVQPLYAHPSPSGDGERVTEDALAKVIAPMLWERDAAKIAAAVIRALATPLTEGGERCPECGKPLAECEAGYVAALKSGAPDA